METVEEDKDKVKGCKIRNKLIPHPENPRASGDKIIKLQSILDSKDWSHITYEQKKQSLFQVIKEHNSLYLLTEKELEKIKTPPVHVNVTDPAQ